MGAVQDIDLTVLHLTYFKIILQSIYLPPPKKNNPKTPTLSTHCDRPRIT